MSWNIKQLNHCGIVLVILLTLLKLSPAESRELPSLFKSSMLPFLTVCQMLTVCSSRGWARSGSRQVACLHELTPQLVVLTVGHGQCEGTHGKGNSALFKMWFPLVQTNRSSVHVKSCLALFKATYLPLLPLKVNDSSQG